jgi:hypothetical protein
MTAQTAGNLRHRNCNPFMRQLHTRRLSGMQFLEGMEANK